MVKVMETRRGGFARGSIDGPRIAALAEGSVRDHSLSGASEAAMDGAFGLSHFSPGLRIHASDTIPRRDFEARFTAPPGLTVAILLDGWVEAEFDGEAMDLGVQGAPGAPAAHIRSLTRPTQVVRRGRRAARARKVNIDVGPDWIAAHDRAGAPPSPGVLDFAARHLAQAQWVPSARAIRAAEELFAPVPDPFLARLAAERSALDILAEAFAMLEGAAPPEAPTPREAARIRAALGWIDDHAAQDLSLAQIASAVGMSVSALQRGVKRCCGCTVAEYRRAARLDRARAALMFDGASVAEAARIAGYRGAANFATAFARRYGAPPSLLRG
jgi:AraC-like DNA-binding protein